MATKVSPLAGKPAQAAQLIDVDKAPGNRAAMGGIKVVSETGWFATRPSGTEDIYKIYAESFDSPQHLQAILEETQGIVDAALAKA